MKSILYLVLLLALFSGCSSEPTAAKNYRNEDPRALIGRWEIIKDYYEYQKLFDLTNESNEEIVEMMSGNFLEIKKNGIVTASSWTKYDEHFDKRVNGHYELDNPTGRIAIRIYEKDNPNGHSGSFRWKIKRDLLFLYATNQRTRYGTYRVYRRYL